MAAMLEYGVPPEGIEPPAEAVEFAVGMLRRGVELAAILRAYRVGHRRLWRIWMQRANAQIDELRRRHRALIGWVHPGAEESGGTLELLEREGTALARRLTDTEPLVMPAGRGVLWIWVGAYTPAEPEPELVVAPEAEASFALGEWCTGDGLTGRGNARYAAGAPADHFHPKILPERTVYPPNEP